MILNIGWVKSWEKKIKISLKSRGFWESLTFEITSKNTCDIMIIKH